MKKTMFAISLVGLCIGSGGCGGATDGPASEAIGASALPLSATPSTSQWLVALCYPSDEPAITVGRSSGFYSRMFSAAGTGSASDYWSSQSYGHHAVTSVISKWISTGHPLSWHKAQGRATNIETCVNATLATGKYNALNFFNYVAVYNGQLDEGAESVNIQNKQLTGVIIDAYSPEGGVLHEMGHGFGLAHAFNDQGVEYGDPYDVMSNMAGYSFRGNYCVPTGAWYACDSGPGLAAWTRWQLGWLRPTQRQMWWPATAGVALRTQNVTLAARNESAGSHPQILYVPASASSMYTVEWVDSDNYDLDNLFTNSSPNQVPRTATNTLLIHKINYGDQRIFLVTASGGVQTTPGNPFFDSTTGVHIALTSTQGSPATATVQITVDDNNTVWQSGTPGNSPPVDSSKVSWVGVNTAVGDTIPSNGLVGGSDATVGALYPCRAWFNGVHLGKASGAGWCSFPWGGGEHFERSAFEVLTVNSGATSSWVDGSNGSLPSNALAAGFDSTYGTLYACRAQVQGNWTPGKFIFGRCSVSFDLFETFYSTYQILTIQ